MAGRSPRPRTKRPARGNYRSSRSKNDHQCTKFWCQVLVGRLRRCLVTLLVQHDQRASESFRCYPHDIDFTSEQGKAYRLKKPALAQMPTIIVRPRGLHLDESHIEVDGEPLSGSLMDFGLYFFHNAEKLVELGRGPYYYLPKLEHHLEARWWNCVFNKAQDYLGIPQGTVRATLLIETITAAFQMEEILYQLRDHAAGLNAGRWDYIFSIIK